MEQKTTKAPLKPQQRLFVLRTNILPALLHQLVLAEYTEGYLDSLDLMVRSKVRLWLKLPHDTVTPFFYANYRDRGLGLVCLRFTVPPAMKLNRFRKATQSEDPILRAIAMSDSFQAELRACEAMQIWKEYQMDVKISRDFAFSHELRKSADCYGLTCTAKVPFVHKWVIDGKRMLLGRGHYVDIMLYVEGPGSPGLVIVVDQESRTISVISSKSAQGLGVHESNDII